MNTKKPLANKNKVYESYDRIGDWFDQNRSRDLSFEEHHLKEVAKHLHAGAKVLDIGCGTGRPIAEYFLSRGFQVTGTDASQKMIDLAKIYIPAARLFLQDMRALSLDEKFDAIILWHSSFHLPAEDQRLLFKRIQDHAHPNALLLFTSGPEHGEAWGENGGEVLYHASLSQEEYKSLLQTHGFKLISLNINDALSGGRHCLACNLQELADDALHAPVRKLVKVNTFIFFMTRVGMCTICKRHGGLMKTLAMFITAMLVSVSSYAGNWKLVASDSVWSTFPTMRTYDISSNEVYSQILIHASLGTARIQNAFLETKAHGDIPLWAIQGDYRSPRDGAMGFPQTQLKRIRMNIMSLERNVPARIQIYVR